MGNGLPQSRQPAAPPLRALRIRTGRRGVIHAALDIRAQAASCRRHIGPVPDRLWQLPFYRRIHPRAGRFSRPAIARHEHGTMAEPADGHCRCIADGLEQPSRHLTPAYLSPTIPIVEMTAITITRASLWTTFL